MTPDQRVRIEANGVIRDEDGRPWVKASCTGNDPGPCGCVMALDNGDMRHGVECWWFGVDE